MKKKLIKLKDKLIKNLKRIKTEKLISNYFKDNKLFIVYVLVCVINSTLLRFFTMPTMENYLSFKAIIADTAVVTIIGSFSYLFKAKKRYTYLLVCAIIFTAICTINSAYYTFYTSFASVSMLSLTQYIGEVGDAVVENVLQIKDLVYILPLGFFIYYYHRLNKRNNYKHYTKETRLKKFKHTIIGGGLILLVFILSLSSLEISRFVKQWNREYIVMRFGIYMYQGNDIIASIQPKISAMFGYDDAKKEFTEYYKDRSDEQDYKNEYTNIFEGRNVIVIHAESMQGIAINRTFNGEEVTPNLNKMIKEGLYFDNFYSQVSVGTSSDTELTYNTSLMPTQNGTAFVSYFDRTYISIPSLLKEKGYYTFSMHANNADFWNRRAMHESLGYDKFYSKETYKVDDENVIGLGLSDKEFFAQSVEKIKKISEDNDKFYSYIITLTNHTPFSDTDKYGEFPVTMKTTITNEDGTTEEIEAPYLEGTKLGNYFKSVHYADEALGEFFTKMDEEGLLDNTVVVIFGDHDARLPRSEFNLMYNYDPATDDVKDEEDPTYVEYDSFDYELDRKVPLIIWTKDGEAKGKVDYTMGMYDLMPTLGNMLGFYNKYALGHDIFETKNDNIVVFPNGNWVTNKMYYNSQKGEYKLLKDEIIDENYIEKNNEYTEQLLDISNKAIVFDLFNPNSEENANNGNNSNNGNNGKAVSKEN